MSNSAGQIGQLGPSILQNVTFDELAVGASARLQRQLHAEDIALFAALSGDLNPTHLDHEYARSTPEHEVIAHGMWGAALISAVLGTRLPGPGTVYLGQTLEFIKPVRVGDVLTVTVRCTGKEAGRRVVLACECANQSGEIVIRGDAIVRAPREKVRRPVVALPTVTVADRHSRLQRLVAKAAGLPPRATAVVHPCDVASLQGALLAQAAGLIDPLLVGPAHRIRAVADAHQISLQGVRMQDAPHSHAAAEQAVELARRGEVVALMKGSLHTDELLGAVLRASGGLRTERRLSHVFWLDVPGHVRPLLVTDAAVNIEPTLEDKADIVRNAIALAHALGVVRPRVALLAAVETINPRMRATLDAAALCKMNERGQIRGGQLDGPLAFDNAISAVAAKIKGIRSDVAGAADVLMVPDLEAGNMLAKQLEYLGHALSAGIAMGAKVPIMLTSRADPADSRIASCALASLWLAHQASGL
jgi:phosphotransacetylase/acyl dehydratase